MKKALISAFVIVIVGAAALRGTSAFFSDTETSVDNTFTAGAIDLEIDNTSYATDFTIPGFENPTGELALSTATTWTLNDLTAEKFFNFVDLKPGDVGEDTISIHVNSNDAWMCAAARITADEDNDITEPENEDGDDGTDEDGELDENLNFVFWVDDGDNVLEDDEVPSIFLNGPLSGIGAAGQITLADTAGGILGANTPIPGGTDFFIGKAWCFGSLTATADTAVTPAEGITPLTAGTGVTCDGTSVDNQPQTDSVVGDLQFYAVQARNNDGFTCSQNYVPTWPEA